MGESGDVPPTEASVTISRRGDTRESGQVVVCLRFVGKTVLENLSGLSEKLISKRTVSSFDVECGGRSLSSGARRVSSAWTVSDPALTRWPVQSARGESDCKQKVFPATPSEY